MRVAVITLGCPRNLVDTEVMLGALQQAGHEFASEPAGADVAIVNTCSFISAAVAESRGVVDDCLRLKRSGSLGRVVVTGCLPQRYGRATLRMFPGVDGVVGCSGFERIADVVRAVEAGEAVFDVGEPDALYDGASPRVLGTPGHIAYVKIAEGCANHCSYCTIPSIRGRLRSRTPDSVVNEVRSLVAGGVVEINLVAQDTTAYGTDIASDVTLAGLIASVDGTGARWVRILYTHPDHITEELLLTMAASSSVVPYLDVPIQHVSNRILSAMGRRTDGDGIRRLLDRVRAMVPGVSIRSSVIVGFPGETEQEFEELRAFVAAGAVDHLGVFEYSPEQGTPAFALPDRVDRETSSRRAAEIVRTMEELSERRGAALVGSERTVLIDEAGSGTRPAVGRTAGQAWELDGVVLVSTGTDGLEVGSFASVCITGASGFDLEGEARPGGSQGGSAR